MTTRPPRLFRVGTFRHDRPDRAPVILAYLRDYNPEWPGCVVYDIKARDGAAAKRMAIVRRKESGK